MSKNRWEKLKTEFETTTISLADLARKYDIPYSTVYGQKKRNRWKKSKSIKMRGNKRAKGNPGNKKASAPKGNKNRVTHGWTTNRKIIQCIEYDVNGPVATYDI